MIQGLIFDMDGLLVDSEPFWRQAQIEIFSALGVQITEADTIRTTGLRIDLLVNYYAEQQPWDTHKHPISQVTEQMVARVAGLINTNKPILPGVIALLEQAKAQQLPMAVASSSPMRLIQSTLNDLGLSDYFEHLLSAETLAHGKPHPEVYLNAAIALGLDPTHCLAFEDSFNGLLAAKSARMKTVVVPESHAQKEGHWIIADKQCQSLEEITLDWIQSL